MKKVTRFVTHDGVEHKNFDAAQRHLDVLYTHHVSGIAAALALLEKYSKTKEYINDKLHAFAEAQRIKDDMNVENDDDQD